MNVNACAIRNSFARGAVAGIGRLADRLGGFVGNLEGAFDLSNNYAWGNVSTSIVK